ASDSLAITATDFEGLPEARNDFFNVHLARCRGCRGAALTRGNCDSVACDGITITHPVPKIPAVSRFFERRRPHDKRNEVKFV
ncbi:hypothetical protein, partial [Escherichia coli]|uniref:hypothetical protein n=1 Tax=Escherichia coli TaxID=562 RepID=UPI001BC89CA1